jgi:hypothetical protein
MPKRTATAITGYIKKRYWYFFKLIHGFFFVINR